MQLKEFDILLDIKKHNKIDYIEVVAGDSFSNVLNISLIDGIYPYDLTNTSVEIVFSKPDGTTVQQTDIAVINSAQGRIQCILKTNTIAAPGKVVAEVRILEGETLLTSTRFEFYVRKAIINDETIESTNEFPVLTQLIATTNDLIQQVEQIEKQVPENVVTQLNQVSNLANQLQTDLAAHKADNVSQVLEVTRDLSITGKQTITLLNKKIKSFIIHAYILGDNQRNILFRGSGGFPIGSTTTITDTIANVTGIYFKDSSGNARYGSITTPAQGIMEIDWTMARGTTYAGTARIQILIEYN